MKHYELTVHFDLGEIADKCRPPKVPEGAKLKHHSLRYERGDQRDAWPDGVVATWEWDEEE